MSLDWDCTDCEKPEAASDEEAVSRKCLVFESGCVNLNAITAGNEDEWMFRSMLLQRIEMSSIMYGTEDWREKAGHLRSSLRRWRGMTTNVTAKSRSEWLKATMSILENEVLRRMPNEEKANAK
jgi:hypothetical protein